MSKSHKRASGPKGERPSGDPKPGSGGSIQSFITWIRYKRPVAGFVVTFVVLMGMFYAITFIDFMEFTALPAYMRANARASTVILNVFGEGATTQGTSVRSSRYSVDIRHGCDAIEPSALFIAAVLAFPAPLRSKLPGLLLGTIVLAVINLTRIVTLFYTGIYRPAWFEAMHVDVWQPVFIVLSLTLWVIWAWWATRDSGASSETSAGTDPRPDPSAT